VMYHFRCTSCHADSVTKKDPPPAIMECKACLGEMLRVKPKPKNDMNAA